MTRDEALQFLGLPDGASPEQIQARFRELALQLHPDRGGNANAVAQLYVARDIALGQSGALALMLVDDVRALVVKSTAAVAARYEAQERKRSTVEQIKRHRTSSLRSLKQTTGMIGLISGVLSLLASDLLPLLPETDPVTMQARAVLVALAVIMGTVYLFNSRRVEFLEGAVEELAQAMGNKKFYLEIMRTIVPRDRLSTSWTDDELAGFIGDWSAGIRHSSSPFGEARRILGFSRPNPVRTAPTLPPWDLANLLIESGRERGLLEEQEAETEGSDRFVSRYRLLVEPR